MSRTDAAPALTLTVLVELLLEPRLQIAKENQL